MGPPAARSHRLERCSFVEVTKLAISNHVLPSVRVYVFYQLCILCHGGHFFAYRSVLLPRYRRPLNVHTYYFKNMSLNVIGHRVIYQVARDVRICVSSKSPTQSAPPESNAGDENRGRKVKQRWRVWIAVVQRSRSRMGSSAEEPQSPRLLNFFQNLSIVQQSNHVLRLQIQGYR